MFENFEIVQDVIDGVHIHARRGGSGPPILLLHGFPQTHVVWHKMAAVLAKSFTVVTPDLRGYGDSGKPEGLIDHSNYSKRRMALDQVAFMGRLGYSSFSVVGHDRGARVAVRLAMDFPDAVQKLVTLDIAPTLAMYEQTTFEFARAYWHWFFLVRPKPLPETLIRADAELFLKELLGIKDGCPHPFATEALAEYLRCLRDPLTAHGFCEDYRAGVTIDLDHDRADIAAGRTIKTEHLMLWGENGLTGKCFDPMSEWARVSQRLTGFAVQSGHFMPEESPQALLDHICPFLASY